MGDGGVDVVFLDLFCLVPLLAFSNISESDVESAPADAFVTLNLLPPVVVTGVGVCDVDGVVDCCVLGLGWLFVTCVDICGIYKHPCL